MNEKQRLEHIENKVRGLLLLGDSEGNGEVNINAIYNDMSWLISQAQKVEQLEREIERLERRILELEDANQTLDVQVQNAVHAYEIVFEKAVRYEKALKEIAEREEPRYQDEFGAYYYGVSETVKQALEEGK